GSVTHTAETHARVSSRATIEIGTHTRVRARLTFEVGSDDQATCPCDKQCNSRNGLTGPCSCFVPALVDGSSSLETPLRVIICIPLSALSSNAHIRLFHWHEANTYFCMASYYIVAPLSLCCTCALEVFEFTLDLVSEGRKQWQPLEVISGNRFPLWLGWKQ
ncbi:hypothetical protein Gotur_000972, partial [Gossypium turneri]